MNIDLNVILSQALENAIKATLANTSDRLEVLENQAQRQIETNESLTKQLTRSEQTIQALTSKVLALEERASVLATPPWTTEQAHDYIFELANTAIEQKIDRGYLVNEQVLDDKLDKYVTTDSLEDQVEELTKKSRHSLYVKRDELDELIHDAVSDFTFSTSVDAR